MYENYKIVKIPNIVIKQVKYFLYRILFQFLGYAQLKQDFSKAQFISRHTILSRIRLGHSTGCNNSIPAAIKTFSCSTKLSGWYVYMPKLLCLYGYSQRYDAKLLTVGGTYEYCIQALLSPPTLLSSRFNKSFCYNYYF